MKLERPTDCYNERRYGKPWIAKVDFSAGSKGTFAFGEWCGQTGEAGLLLLDAPPGAVIAWGQKDFRRPRNSAPTFAILETNGTLRECTKPEAFRYWRESQAEAAEAPAPLAACTDDEILAEARRRGLLCDRVTGGTSDE